VQEESGAESKRRIGHRAFLSDFSPLFSTCTDSDIGEEKGKGLPRPPADLWIKVLIIGVSWLSFRLDISLAGTGSKRWSV